ncbi:MAG: hypothetical protein AB9M60_02540 [Leptothrix sp. (in: b-proteobacteria)]
MTLDTHSDPSGASNADSPDVALIPSTEASMDWADAAARALTLFSADAWQNASRSIGIAPA